MTQKSEKNWFQKHGTLSRLGTLLILTLIIQGCSSAAGSPSTPPPKQTEPDREQVISITARDLYAEYSNNEIAADQKYDDKLLRVSGTVEGVGKDIFDDMYVSLKTDDILGNVRCMLSDSEASEAASLTEGQSIVVGGKNTDFLMDVTLKGCVIL